MKPGSKPTVEQYTSKSNHVDMNPVGIQQGWMQIQNRREERSDQAYPVPFKQPTPAEIAQMQRDYKVEDAHRENFECCRGSATFEAGKILAKE